MIYHCRGARPPLSGSVAQLWYCADYRAAHRLERILPDGSSSLVVALRDESIPVYNGDTLDETARLGPSLAVGARDSFDLVHTQTLDAMAGVQFRPGCAAAFLGCSGAELAGASVDLEAVWGRGARRVRERMLEAGSPEAVLDALEDELLAAAGSALGAPAEILAAVHELRRTAGRLTVEEVVERSGMGHGRFLRRFRDAVGLAPKRFARLQRFRHALRLSGRVERIRWADIALECGYFDQAHFNRDFRAFAGVPPTAYLDNRGEWESHLVVHPEP